MPLEQLVGYQLRRNPNPQWPPVRVFPTSMGTCLVSRHRDDSLCRRHRADAARPDSHPAARDNTRQTRTVL